MNINNCQKINNSNKKIYIPCENQIILSKTDKILTIECILKFKKSDHSNASKQFVVYILQPFKKILYKDSIKSSNFGITFEDYKLILNEITEYYYDGIKLSREEYKKTKNLLNNEFFQI